MAAVVCAAVLTAGALAACKAKAPEGEPKVATAAAVTTGPGRVPSVDGLEIAYTLHSLGSPTLVLVHGWMCNQGYWSAQVPALAEKFGVVTVDLGGHGASGRNRKEWTIASLAEDVQAVITHLGLHRVIVAGHSMGGRVALEVAHRLPGTVIGIIGVDTLHTAADRYDPEQVKQLLTGLEQDFATTCSGLVRGMFVPGAEAALVERVVGDMCSGPGEIGAALLRSYVEFDMKSAFGRAGVPIRALNSDLWPTDVEGNRAVADFDAVILKGYGHFLMQEAPEELARAMVETADAIATTPPRTAS
jgi:pimeloyl-ACP methyl ester carboxylesterase